MSATVTEILNKAKSWMGKNEADGSHKEIIDIYNAHKPLARGYSVKYTDAWCATFVSAVAIECGATDVIPTECGCEKQIELFKEINAWEESDARIPVIGDIVFYDWNDSGSKDNTGHSDHVGIVSDVTSETFTVIEGNFSNAVKTRTMGIDGKYIRGFGVPKYEESAEEWEETSVDSKKEDKILVDGSWGKLTTSAMQEVFEIYEDGIISNQSNNTKKYHLNCLESSWEYDDNDIGSNTIMVLQKLLGETVDGKMGPLTIKAMQGFAGVAEDGYMGPITVKAIQQWINNH